MKFGVICDEVRTVFLFGIVVLTLMSSGVCAIVNQCNFICLTPIPVWPAPPGSCRYSRSGDRLGANTHSGISERPQMIVAITDNQYQLRRSLLQNVWIKYFSHN
jgi:hypothetical protein